MGLIDPTGTNKLDENALRLYLINSCGIGKHGDSIVVKKFEWVFYTIGNTIVLFIYIYNIFTLLVMGNLTQLIALKLVSTMLWFVKSLQGIY